MHVERLRRRLKHIVPLEGARLEHHLMNFGKRGVDGSAKCNIEPAADSCVFGVMFRLRESLLADLDVIEGSGYARITVLARGLNSDQYYQAYCYRAKAKAVAADSLPFDWYRAFVVDGARMHGLPEPYVAALACIPARPDPNRFRQRRQQNNGGLNFGSYGGSARGYAVGPKSGWLINGCYRDRHHDVSHRFGL